MNGGKGENVTLDGYRYVNRNVDLYVRGTARWGGAQ